MKTYTKEQLINFEKEVIKEFKKGETYGAVHLSGGNEEQLINIFKDIKDNDWVFSTHRSHYHALLKSGNKKWLIDGIIKQSNSSHINSKKYKIFTSAIVGGIIPIALGTAMALKMRMPKPTGDKGIDRKSAIKYSLDVVKGNIPHVWCFVGDMASEMGCLSEALKYANGENLPITFIIEDNNLGCNTPTSEVWKKGCCDILEEYLEQSRFFPKIIYYKYKRYYPHYGIGEWVILKDKNVKTQGDYSTHKLK